MSRSLLHLTIAVLLLIALAGASPADRSLYVAGAQWTSYNGSPSNSHFSSLNQINRGNVTRLIKAWEYRSGDGPRPGYFEFNPLIVDGILYLTAAGGALAALDAGSGRERWRFKPAGPIFNTRGASFWRDPRAFGTRPLGAPRAQGARSASGHRVPGARQDRDHGTAVVHRGRNRA